MKKNLKRVLAAGLAATMVMGTASVAMADVYDKSGNKVTYPGNVTEDTSFTDVVSLDLSKTYKAFNSQSSNPAEDFKFEISCVGVTDSQIDKIPNDLIPSFTQPKVNEETGKEEWVFDNVGEIHFNEGEIVTVEGETTTLNDTNSIKIYLPDYEYVGIYTYKIKELAGTTAGVTYDSKPLYLKVTVIEQGGKVRVAALHYETEDGDKTESFVNTYAAGSLEISKTVTGNLGEKERYFEVKVKLIGEEGVTYKESYPVSGGSYKVVDEDGNVTKENPKTISMNNETSFWLKDTDKITIENLPEGVRYTVKEEDYTDTATNIDNKLGYKAAIYTNSDDAENKTTGEGTISYTTKDETTTTGEGENAVTTTTTVITGVDADSVAITNQKGAVVDTGISLDSMPYLMTLALSAMGALGFVSKKRKEEDEI